MYDPNDSQAVRDVALALAGVTDWSGTSPSDQASYVDDATRALRFLRNSAPSDSREAVVVSWSGKRHYALPGGRQTRSGLRQARCSDSTFGAPVNPDGTVAYGTKRARSAALLPLCKSCIRSSKAVQP